MSAAVGWCVGAWLAVAVVGACYRRLTTTAGRRRAAGVLAVAGIGASALTVATALRSIAA